MLVGHKKQWEFLKNKFESEQLAHAYLFAGADGIGKKLFVKEFAGFIGCKFPDLIIVETEERKEPASLSQGGISIAKIREVQNFLSYKSYYGNFKIVAVDNAHLMNREAQSCFLKTLEEPKGKTILFLVTSKPDTLLPTIVSRCQVMKFFRPENLPQNAEEIEKEEKILKDLLGVINSNFSEKFKYVKSIDFEKQNPAEIIQVLEKHLRSQLLKSAFEGKPIFKIKENINLVEEINNKLMFTNANPKLALENLLINI